MFDRTRYSEAKSLAVFLPTLSYHRVGADFIAEALVDATERANWSLLDVGCGNGMFTRTLIEALRARRIGLPTEIYAIDPDPRNLHEYRELVASVGINGLTTKACGLEECYVSLGGHEVVIASHSLYGVMENDELSSQMKEDCVTSLVRATKPGGAAFMSMASCTSQAYNYKRGVLRLAGRPDVSAFGEGLVAMLESLSVIHSAVVKQSYMDVTSLLVNDHKLVLWAMYFCRLREDEVLSIGIDALKAKLRLSSEQFGSLDQQEQDTLRKYPAEMGPPTSSSRILRHCEVFVTVSPSA